MDDDDAREAARARIRREAKEVATEDRAQLWDQFGFDIRTGAGILYVRQIMAAWDRLGIDVTNPSRLEMVRLDLDWLRAAREASVTRNVRLLKWITGAVTMIGTVLGIIKIYLDWRGHPL